MSVTNQELVNLLVQTKLEKLKEEIEALSTELDQEVELLKKEGEEILTLLGEEAIASVDPEWLAAIQLLANSGFFSADRKKRERKVQVKMAWENPFFLVRQGRVSYYHNEKFDENLPKNLTAYVYVREGEENENENAISMIRNEPGGYAFVGFKPSKKARENWKTFYAKVKAWEEKFSHLEALQAKVSDAGQIEKRALAALTKRTIEKSSELQAELRDVIADVLSDTKLLSG